MKAVCFKIKLLPAHFHIAILLVPYFNSIVHKIDSVIGFNLIIHGGENQLNLLSFDLVVHTIDLVCTMSNSIIYIAVQQIGDLTMPSRHSSWLYVLVKVAHVGHGFMSQIQEWQ